MQRKKFVKKSYQNRYESELIAASQRSSGAGMEVGTYPVFNKAKTFNELAAYKFYQRVCNVPKAYITGKTANDYKIVTRKISSSTSLGEYIDKALRKIGANRERTRVKKYLSELFTQENDEKANQAKNKIKTKLGAELNKINGLGEICFMGMLLGDNDVFGQLDNVRIHEGNKFHIVKIDPAESDLQGELFDKDMFSKVINNLINGQGFMPDAGMPNFDRIFSLLNEKQKTAGIAAVKSLTDEVLFDTLNWLGQELGFDLHVQHNMFNTLKFRRDLIIEKFDPQNKITPRKNVNPISQNVIFRPETDFEETEEKCPAGRSRPVVTEKIRSEKQERALLFFIKNELVELISDLEEKSKAMKDQVGKENKKALIDESVNALRSISNELQPEDKGIYTRDMIFYVYGAMDPIIHNLTDNLKNDPTEKGLLYSIRRKFSDMYKSIIGTRSSTIGIVEKHQEALNDKFFGFFSSLKFAKPTKEEEKIKDSKKEKHSSESSIPNKK